MPIESEVLGGLGRTHGVRMREIAPLAGSPAIYELDGHEYVAIEMRGKDMAFAMPKTGSKR